MSLFSYLIHRVIAIIIKIPTGVFMALEKQIFTFIWKDKKIDMMLLKRRRRL